MLSVWMSVGERKRASHLLLLPATVNWQSHAKKAMLGGKNLIWPPSLLITHQEKNFRPPLDIYIFFFTLNSS